MKIVKPAEMTLLSCSISETDAVDGVVWSASTTYSQGDKVRYNHVSYKSLENNNTNHRPDLNWVGENAYWQKLTATMPYRMLDDYQETQTVAPVGQDLTFSVSFTLANSFAFMNIHGGSMEIEITDSETTLYSETVDLVDDITSLSLWEYYFLPITTSITDPFVNTELPLCINATLNVTIHPAGSADQVALGHVVVGRYQYVGETKYGADIGLIDYSRKDVDAFGYVNFVRRSYSKNASINLFLPPILVNNVTKFLSEIRATPVLFCCGNSDNGFEALSIYGWIENWRTVYVGPKENELTVEIQGLI